MRCTRSTQLAIYHTLVDNLSLCSLYPKVGLNMSVKISILESLTASNPDIQYDEPGNYVLTANKLWLWPKQLKE
jgi:hypothetical protein